MRKLAYTLLILSLIIASVAAVLWLLPARNVHTVQVVRHVTVHDTLRVAPADGPRTASVAAPSPEPRHTAPKPAAQRPLTRADVRRMAQEHPFYAEARKIVEGKLQEQDAVQRQLILDYCEHLRTAYTTRDIDFLRQVFSEQALIIVGSVVKTGTATAQGLMSDERVKYHLRTKREYLQRLEQSFRANRSIDVRFSDFRILRHPTHEGIYGVSMQQAWQSDRYADEGQLFLLWDFSDPAMPQIHVRTWQPVGAEHEPLGLQDFNLE